MSKFNSVAVDDRKTTNQAGGTAYKLSDKDKLMTQVLTSFFNEKKYYGDNSNEILHTVRGMLNNDPKFVANLCIYARNEMYLRSITHMLVSELAKHNNGKKYVRKTLNKIVQRPDDMAEILSYYIGTYGKPIPNSLKKGLADVFVNFDEYSLQKYNSGNKSMKLKDILFIVHPTPRNQEQYDMWKRLIEDNLATPLTWETELSIKGNTKEVWENLINKKAVGYMAALRNLRNIINSGANNLDQILNYLQNPEAIRKSKQLPFRYFSAYREIEGVHNVKSSGVLDAIENALDISTENVPRFSGNTLIVADTSGSMNSSLSERSKVTYNDVGTLLMSIANKFCDNVITSVFAENFKVVNVSKRNGIIGNMKTFQSTNVGYSTNLHLAFNWMLNQSEKFDRVIVFSDMQAYNHDIMVQSYIDKYRSKLNPELWVHSIDLAGYGSTQFIGKNTNLMGGWSDKTLEFIHLAEEGIDTLVNKIEGHYFK